MRSLIDPYTAEIATRPFTRRSFPVRHYAGSEGALVGREPMTGNEDLRLAAEGVLAAHGDRAIRECEAVIAKMMERGDKAGEANWKNILAAVRQIQAPG